MPEKIPIPVATIKNADDQPDAPKAESWRDGPYLKLESELSRVKDVEDLIDQYGESGRLGDEVKNYYEAELEKDSEVKELLGKLDTLREMKSVVWKEIGVRKDKLREAYARGVDSTDEYNLLSIQLEPVEKEHAVLCQEIKDLEENPDILFFSRLRTAADWLGYRLKNIEECKEDPAKFLAIEDRKLAGMPYEDIIYKDASITYIVSPEVWDQYLKKPNSLGVHKVGSIISVVKRNTDKEKEKSTINHENKHALYEVFFDQENSKIFGAHNMRAIKEDLIAMMGKGIPEERIEKEFEKLHTSVWQEYLTGIKDEIIANFDGLKQGIYSSDFYIYVDIFETLQWKTGGVEVDKRLEGMSEQDKAEFLQAQEFYKTQFDKVSDRFKAECQKFYRDLADLFYLAEKENLTEELHSAMLLFDPLDYNKIKQYLTWKIGREKTATYQALRRIVRSPFFQEPKVAEPVGGDLDTRLIDAIKKRKAFEEDKVVQAMILEVPADAYSAENIDKISLDELRKIKLTEEEKVVFEEGASKYFFEGVGIHPSLLDKDLQYISEYIDKLQWVCSILDIDLNMREVREIVWADYVYHRTEELLLRNDEDGLVSLLHHIGVSERPYLSQALLGVKDILEERSQYNESWKAALEEIRLFYKVSI